MKVEIEKQVLEKALKEYKSMKATAKYFNVNEKTIARICKEYGLTSSVGSQGARKHFCNDFYFSNIDNEEKAYWLGFIFADGCVYKGSDKHSYRLQINLKHADKNHLEKFLQALSSNYSIADKLYKGSEISQLKINSTTLCKDLIELGVTPKKSLICTFPNIDKEWHRHFIRGYFDGDGCITSNANYTKNSFSIVGGQEMLAAFKDIFDCKSAIYAIKHSLAYSLEASSKDSLMWIYNYLYKNSTIHLERKKEKFEKVMSHLVGIPSKEQSELRGSDCMS